MIFAADKTSQLMSPVSRAGKWSVLLVLSLASPLLAFGQANIAPVGGEYNASGALAGEQLRPAMTISSEGGFVVWDDNVSDPSGQGLSARRLDANGAPFGEPFVINATLGRDQQNASIAPLQDGGAVIVWEGGKGGAQNIFARFLKLDGSFVGGEVLVNTPAHKDTHRFTTNWTLIRNNRATTRPHRIQQKILNRQEFNSRASVATLNDGSVVVVYGSSRKESIQTVTLNESLRWDDRREIFITNRTRVPLNLKFDYLQDVYFRRLSATGEPLGPETLVNQNRPHNQRAGSVAALADGGFVVVFVDEAPEPPGNFVSSTNRVFRGAKVQLKARLYNADASPRGTEFRVDTTASPVGTPSVAGRTGGGFTVAWVAMATNATNGVDVWFRAYNVQAQPEGAPVLANSYLPGDQFAPSIANAGANQLLVWSSMKQDGSWEGVYGRVLQGNAVAGDEFLVNTRRHLRQIQPRVTTRGTEAWVVWSGYLPQSGHDIYAQRFQLP
jgi:hypothetical protein